MDPFGVVGTAIAGKYRVDRAIGEGGFGVVYAGFHLVIGQPVAIKVMKPVGSPEDRARTTDAFLREARVLFDLAHPSIVRLYDVGVTATRLGDVPYVVLELIAGMSLAQEVARRQRGEAPAFAVAEIGAIFDGLLDGLATAHARGVVHRDLKPSNVMLTRDATGHVTAKILDFGTARAGTGAAGGSAGPVGFTPLYAAPEQWDARFGPTGPATDVFAAGLLLAETALLAPPLGGEGMAQIAGAAMDGARRPSISARRPDVPREVDGVLLRATRPSPTERFANAGEMRVALRAAFAGQMHPSYAPPARLTPVPLGGAGVGFAPGGSSVTTHAPVQHPVHHAPTMPSRAAGPHPVSVLALIVGLATLGAVIALAIVFVTVLRREEPSAMVPATTTPTATDPPAATATAAATTPPTAAATPAPRPSPTPAPTPTPSHTPTPPPGPERVIVKVGMAGQFDAAELASLAEAHHGELVRCYRTSLAHDRTLRGTATITVFNTLGPQDCRFSPQPGGEADALCACTKAAIATWKIPKPNSVFGSSLFEYEIFYAP